MHLFIVMAIGCQFFAFVAYIVFGPVVTTLWRSLKLFLIASSSATATFLLCHTSECHLQHWLRDHELRNHSGVQMEQYKTYGAATCRMWLMTLEMAVVDQNVSSS